MLLTVLVGNTSTRLTRFRGRTVLATRAVPTTSFRRDPARWLAGAPRPDVVALCSVVPGATRPTREAIRARLDAAPFVLTAAARTGLDFDYDRHQLGLDRVCVAVGARTRFQGNLIVLDFGTAVTVNAVTADGRFLGGAILPGPEMMLDALHERTGRLPRARLAGPVPDLPRATTPALRAGAFAAVLGGVERLIAGIERGAGRRFKVVATGGGAARFRRRLPRIAACDPLLAARGLAAIWELNHRR